MVNISRRLERLENRQMEETFSVEIIFYKESEDPQKKLREKELNKKIDTPIYIKIIK